MVFCNLKVLLAQRNISISKVSAVTNISRTTITALCSNKSTGIQFETLNTICGYLNILPSDLLIFSPYDFRLTRNLDYLEIHITNKLNNANFTVVFAIDADEYYVNFEHLDGDENYDEDDEFDSYDYRRISERKELAEKQFKKFQSIVSTLPKCYLSFLDEQIKSLFAEIFDKIEPNLFSIETCFY